MTGLRHARGAYVITMDDDLQNPPGEVIRLYDHARLGDWDVVYTRYAEKRHVIWRNLGSRFATAWRTFSWISLRTSIFRHSGACPPWPLMP